MAVQYECDCCHDTYDIDTIIYIERYEQMLCAMCINEIINSLQVDLEPENQQ